MHDQIDRLISLYGRLGRGSFNVLFGNDPRKFFIRIAFDQICLIWPQVLDALKMRITLEEVKHEQQENQTVKLNELLKEIEALKYLETCFDCTVTEENARLGASSASGKNEKYLLNKLESNPMRC